MAKRSDVAARILTFGRVQELAMASTKAAGYSVEIAVVPVREIEIDQYAASRQAAADASHGGSSQCRRATTKRPTRMIRTARVRSPSAISSCWSPLPR